MDNILIRSAVESDLFSIADTHRKCFKGFLISSLGVKLVQRYYKVFLHEAPELFFVAEDTQGSLVGFVMGYFPNSTALKKFEKENFLALAFRIGLLCIFFNKNAWESGINRLRSWSNTLSGQKKTSKTEPENKYADLLSICVIDKYRGSGVSMQLVTQFELVLKGRNYNCYTLSTGTENIRAKHFYLKSGMKIISETQDEIKFIKNI